MIIIHDGTPLGRHGRTRLAVFDGNLVDFPAARVILLHLAIKSP